MDLLRLCILLLVCYSTVLARSIKTTRLSESENDAKSMLIETYAQPSDSYVILAERQHKSKPGTFLTELNELKKSLSEQPARNTNDIKSDNGDNFKVTGNLNSEANSKNLAYESNLREDSERKKRSVGLDTFYSETDLLQKCSLSVSQASVDLFQTRVLHDGATSLILNLTFSNNINITASTGVILPFKWGWVFRETSQLLKMPYPARVWSLGLLALHTGQPINVELSFTNLTASRWCSNNHAWSIGDSLTNQVIGNALAKMTEVVAEDDPKYDTSHWCYIRRILGSGTGLAADFGNILFRTIPMLEHVCCRYNYTSQIRSIICEERHEYDPVWWQCPIGLGILMFLYFPMIFLKVSGMIHKKILESSSKASDVSDNTDQTHDASQTTTENTALRGRQDKVYLNGKSPITALSIILSNLSRLMPSKQTTKSRMAVFVFTLSTVLVPGVELFVYNLFLHDYVIDLTKSNATIGFSAVLGGWKANDIKLTIFYGPYVALGLYFIIGWLLLLTRGLSSQLYDGVSLGYQNSKSILTISIEEKERLGSVKIKDERNGYFRIFRLQKSHIYMLVNPDFWVFVAQTYKNRWFNFLTRLKQCIHSNNIAIVLSMPLFPFYVVMSLIELVVAVSFYAVPLFSFFVCVIRGLTLGLSKYVSGKCCTNHFRVVNILRFLLGGFVLLSLVYYLYIFSVLFFDGFLFLSRILMFTYTAVVAYPRETYGYFMLVLISAYYGLKGFIHFGDIYKHILKISIKLCKHDEVLQ